MAASPERRSPSLDSMSSVSSTFSFNDITGATSNSPNITAQSAPQGIIDWMQGDQTNLLNEPNTTKGAASLDDEHSKSFEAPQAPVYAYTMHQRFCFPAENIYFLVEGVLYSVHRYFFERDSSAFVGQGLSKQEPMVLANVSMHDLDLFLSILYPTSFGAYPASTVEEWSGILYLADKWSFQSIRALAIAQIAPIASPIDKIVFGRLYDINEWLASAYQAVCTRLDALTLEEGRRLGVDDAIRINSIRQDFCFVRVSESSPKLLEDDVESRFGLAMQTEHFASRESMKDVAGRLKVDSTAEATSKKEEAARAATMERKKKAQEAARQREEEVKSKEAANAAEIERKKVEQLADKKAKDLETKNMQEQCEAEAKSEEEAKVAEIERQERLQEAADKMTKESSKKKSKKDMGKAKPAAVISTISKTPIATAANEDEDWSQLTPMGRYWRKEQKFAKERDTEERAVLVKQARQQLTDEARAAEGGATQQVPGGTSDVSDGASSASITKPDGMSGVLSTSMGTAAIKKDDWSHLTPSERYEKKVAKAWDEIQDDKDAERAAKSVEVLKEVKQQMADEAKAAEEAAAQQGAGSCSALDCHGGPDPHLCGWHSGA
ncbi:hypothetical protein FIBSPDRAFT_1049701 [Athelia psychrophila]|uniref:BTB domain-containing protein n=1 Tax=Athelia psychrophila TaxID=1759441 RepID=A0A166BUH8_9AGAM|nr:hypothetical protein FIBSPDRAFT_1049701 [Fibularhizoctonia sp. CBS 109695]